jgi:hypothetical protein
LPPLREHVPSFKEHVPSLREHLAHHLDEQLSLHSVFAQSSFRKHVP